MKKTISLVLAVMMTMTLLMVSVLAAPSGTYSLGLSGVNTALKSYSLGSEVRPNDEESFYIFLNGNHALRQDIRSDKIDVKRKGGQGSRAVQNATLKYDSNGYAYIKVEFVDPFVSTKELDFTVTLYLTANKSRLSETELEITGTLENDIEYVDEHYDYFDMTDCPVIEAEDYVKSIQLYVGDGLSIFTKLFDGKKYYAYVTQDITPADDEVMSKHPTIETIYNLQTINLSGAGNTVEFDLYERFYVYNKDLEYIGTTDDRLPYSTKYYLSTVTLDIEYEAEENEFEDLDLLPIPDINPDMGGDDVPSNIHDNPGTGR